MVAQERFISSEIFIYWMSERKGASHCLMYSINLRKGLFPCFVWVNSSVYTVYWSRAKFQVLQCPFISGSLMSLGQIMAKSE